MATYNSQISRNDAAALIPEDVQREIIKNVSEGSAVLSLARRLPNMATNQRRLPVLSSLPTAYFVNGDTGLKQTTESAWANKYVDAEEIACIVPIPEAVLDDASYDIWAEVRPLIESEIGRVIDRAIMLGENAPTSWPDDLLTAATAASHVVDESTQVAAGEDLYDMILGDARLVSMVEADGYMVNGYVAQMAMRGKLRGLRDDSGNGQPIFRTLMNDATRYTLDGEQIVFPRNGSLLASDNQLMFAGDWTQIVYSWRQEITYKILDQAVIQDGSGNIVYNLAQQDMVALRAVVRLGWQVPNPINRLQATEASRYPFAVLVK